MRYTRASSGPFKERPFYEDSEIDEIALEALRAVDLLPSQPEPVRVDRFVEKRFDVVPQYADLPSGVLGFTRFGPSGAEAVVLSRSLSEEGSSVAERRLNSTLAHEAGHLLLHGHLFALERRPALPFPEDLDATTRKILCRSNAVGATKAPSPRYDGQWWEFQANQMIGALLMPRPSVEEALAPMFTSRGRLGIKALDGERRDVAIHHLATLFEVNPAVARLRLEKILVSPDSRQLTL